MINRLSRPFEVKELSDSGTISGYGSVFGVKDWYEDIVAPGAFSSSLAQRKPLMLWQHDTAAPIGVWAVAKEDEKGLYLEGQLALKTQQGLEAYELLKLKALDGLSIGFNTLRYEYDEKTDVRTLLEIDLWEVSPVSFPANEASRVTAVKSTREAGYQIDIRLLEEALRDAGLTRTEAKSVLRSGFAALRDAAPPAPRDVGRSGSDLKELFSTIRAGLARVRG